jgi:acetylornithine deacetylase/succinyl-diaminopimelate desuccinylase-like protein
VAELTIDWKVQSDEAVAWLQRLIRFDTTNPPGNELPLVRDVAGTLEAEGIGTRVLESAPERGNLVARLHGDGSERPMLLLSHLDVVPAEATQWTHPPFAAQIANGMVYGRGAIDSKLTTAVQLQVLLICKRMGMPLKRDLVLVAAADEEMGATHGVQWLAANHPEVFDAEYGINEAGGFALLVDGTPVYTCQIGEKGGAVLDLVAHGRPGHSSVPHDDNALFHLAEVLKRLAARKMPHRVTASARAFFEATAAAQRRPEIAELLLQVLDPDKHEAALARLPVNEPTRLMFDAMVRNTCAPTLLEAGVKRNVIPSTATAMLSGRTLPGVAEEEFLQEIRGIVGVGSQVDGVEYQLASYTSGSEVNHETPLFDALVDGMKRYDPEGVVVPYMVTGGTDVRWLSGFDTQIYGFIPLRYEEGMDFFDLCHGHDERVSIANVELGVQVLFDAVCRLNGIEP